MTLTLDEARSAGGKKAVLLFPQGVYDDALAYYFHARDFLLANGLCFHDRVSGLLKSPEFDGQASPSPIPPEWLDQPKWRTRVEIECLDHRAVKDVQKLAVPTGAQLEWGEL